jgi:hypothetical protein
MNEWFGNPFVGFSQNSLSMQDEEQLTELQCDSNLKTKFNEVRLDVFWVSVRKEYPVISAKAAKILRQFSNSYLCEQLLSCLTNIKSKDRNRLLSVKKELQACLTKIRPRIQHLHKKKQTCITLKVNFTMTLDVNFILKFNFILTCYFDIL